MEQPLMKRQKDLLTCLSKLPRKMVQIHGRANLSEFLLHELCSRSCFNLQKAAYFVDNPDFNCLRGVAGYDSGQVFDSSDMWQKPDEFSLFMTCCSFHNKVKEVIHENRSDDNLNLFLTEVGKALGFNGCCRCSWQMKHDNHDILVYEKSNPQDTTIDDYLLDGISFLSFCPIH